MVNDFPLGMPSPQGRAMTRNRGVGKPRSPEMNVQIMEPPLSAFLFWNPGPPPHLN